MRALLWKDVRLNSLLLAFGAALWLAPYAAGVPDAWAGAGGAADPAAWARLLARSAPASLELTLLTLLLLGSNAIVRERYDRSAEFLAYLPPSRLQSLASRATVPLAFGAAAWGAALVAARVVAPALGGDPAGGGAAEAWWELAVMSVVVFGAGWLGSSLADAPFTAIGFGVAASLLTRLGVRGVVVLLGLGPVGPAPPATARLYPAAVAVGVAAGLAYFAAGCWVYLRRVDP